MQPFMNTAALVNDGLNWSFATVQTGDNNADSAAACWNSFDGVFAVRHEFAASLSPTRVAIFRPAW